MLSALRRATPTCKRYRDGSVGVEEFANFYVGTLSARPIATWGPLRQTFLDSVVVPRIPDAARALVARHLDAGDLVVLTTATHRFLTELTAAHFGIVHLIATEPDMAHGEFTGSTRGTLNMREGKVARLHHWLPERGQRLEQFHSTAYSDSMNLDSAVGRARVGCWGRVRSRRDNAAGSCLQDGARTPGASSVAQSGA